MPSFDQYIPEYRKQLEKGTVKAAYQGLMKYFNNLRICLKNSQPDYFISDVHYGLMDYTYLYFFPKELQRQKLKVVILFSHDTFKFELLLAGYNREAQAKYWKLFKEKSFGKYSLSEDANEMDRFLSWTIIEKPDFSDPEALTNQISMYTLKFIEDVESFLKTQ
jgi:hypothetical protein